MITGKSCSYLLAAGLMAGCAPQTGAPDSSSGRKYHFISHADPENPFWGTVRTGMQDAAERFGVEAEFFGATDPRTTPAEQQTQRIEEAVAANVHGIAVTISDAAVLERPLQAAVAAGVPVIAFNVGLSPEDEENYDIPLSGYVGQVETFAAEKSALRAKELFEADGAVMDKAVCIKGMNEAAWAVQRCDGVVDSLSELGITVDVLGGDFYAQPPSIPEDTIRTWFQDNPDVDFVFSTAPAVLNTLLSLKQDGLIRDDAILASVDLNEETQDAIKSGACDFAVDQQPYLQGYMPIVLFELQNDYLLKLGDSVHTGPFFVDSSNVDEIATLVKQKIR